MNHPLATPRATRQWLNTLWRAANELFFHPVLLIGVISVTCLMTAALWPSRLAPYDPNEKGPVFQEIDGQMVVRPYPPGFPYLLGTDTEARDLLSRLIHGTRITLSVALAAVALRVVLGASFGWLAIQHPGRIRQLIFALTGLSASVPGLLFAFMVIIAIGPDRGSLAFIIGLGLAGWASWMHLVYNHIQRIYTEPYMEAARAVGSTARAKIRYYFLPNFLPVFIPTTSQEIAAVLLLLAELGFIGLFLGSPRLMSIEDLMRGARPDLPIPEWGGMLAGTRFYFSRWYWLPLVPAIAFASAIFAFHLLAEGLRQILDPAMRRHLIRGK